MHEERYPGERRGLSLFLESLQPVVGRELGRDSMLHHCIRRALRSMTLQQLRHARQMFNNLPRELRTSLSRGLVSASAPPRGELLEAYSQREPAPFVCFESETGSAEPTPTTVGIRHELLESSEVRVLVRPGTLPSSAASSLREIADMIEGDRRLLSDRYWWQRDGGRRDRDGAERS
jgi:hypothetical protein